MDNSFFSGSERRAQRMATRVSENTFVSNTTYNMIMGGVILYGLILTALLADTVGLQIVARIGVTPFIILYMVMVIAGSIISNKSDKPLISFLGYNMIVLPLGCLVSLAVYIYGGIGSDVVTWALYYTALITVIMMISAILFPGFFSKIGGFLFVALVGILFVEILSSFFGGNRSSFSLITAAIFSLYIGYDFYRSQQFPKTVDNAIDCAADIYLDIINLFLRILSLLSRERR